ncbi:probable 2-oxoglutarate-dependent dioxygenase At5g05600 [Oryza brachyantha]|uniref:probable 2-oxoglutarate-dependent dioxygenase At5g05600 n=1 Tax=Oryza brachyantha TaxID=4533 RepID=UPI001ADAB85F|nr:probable 2-oxoglutarate-dependent dioxygenase At5g05600 [Oryza brachyantha]
MSSCFNGGAGWPEPVVRVQAVSDSCGATIPERYVKAASERPSLVAAPGGCMNNNIPVVDMSMPDGEETTRAVAAACREWGFFQAVNHGVRPELLRRARAAWRGFFGQPAEVRERYANSPATYEGYGSRLGTAKGGPLDWGDYYFLHLLPPALKSHDKWPSLPHTLRETTEEYAEEVVQLCRRVMRVLSTGLGLDDGRLQAAFGGAGGEGACLRVNFYPRCPQPELTLGVASHSDPGGMTMLLVDDHVRGLQVRNADQWITVDPVPDAFIVNIGDQIQVLSNAAYKSVEHRVAVSAAEERLSLAFFYNPRSDLPLAPMPELVAPPARPPLYPSMTFDEYREHIRRRGLSGKAQLQSLQTTTKTCAPPAAATTASSSSSAGTLAR